MELGLESGESRILKKGDSAVQRATTHWWRNTSRTEPAMMAAVSVGIEGAVEDEMRIEGLVEGGFPRCGVGDGDMVCGRGV